MLYEIYFDPSHGVWRIRITTIYLLLFFFSRDVHARCDDEPVLKPMGFNTYDDAAMFAASIGLPQVYTLRQRNTFSSFVLGEGCHAQGGVCHAKST